VELFALAHKQLNFFVQTLLHHFAVILLLDNHLRVLSQQLKSVDCQLRNTGPKVGRLETCISELFDLGIVHPLKGVRKRAKPGRLVECAVRQGLLSRHFIKGNRSDRRTLIFDLIEELLVQALLLLRDQSLLECQNLVSVSLLHELVQLELVLLVPFDLFKLRYDFLALFLIQGAELVLQRLEIVSCVAFKDLLLEFVVLVADEYVPARHAPGGLTHTIYDQIELVQVKGNPVRS